MQKSINVFSAIILTLGLASLALGGWSDLAGLTRAKLASGEHLTACQTLSHAKSAQTSGLFSWPGRIRAARLLVLDSGTDGFSGFACWTTLTMADGSTFKFDVTGRATQEGDTLQSLSKGQKSLLVWDSDSALPFAAQNLQCSVVPGATTGLTARIILQIEK